MSAEKEFRHATTDAQREDAALKLTELERDEKRAKLKRETICQRGIAMIDDKTFEDDTYYVSPRTVELTDAAKRFLDQYCPRRPPLLALPPPPRARPHPPLPPPPGLPPRDNGCTNPLALTNGSAPSSHPGCFPPEKGDAEPPLPPPPRPPPRDNGCTNPLALTNGSAPSSHPGCFPPEKGDADAGAAIRQRRRRRRRRGGASSCDAPENSEAGSQPPKRDERREKKKEIVENANQLCLHGLVQRNERDEPNPRSDKTEAGIQPPKRESEGDRTESEAKNTVEIVMKMRPPWRQEYCRLKLAQIEGRSEGPDASNIEGDTDAGIRQPMPRTRSGNEVRAVKRQRTGTRANDESARGGDSRNRGGATTVAAVHNAVISDGDPEYYEGPEATPSPGDRWVRKVNSADARGDAVIATFDVSYVSRDRDDIRNVELQQIVDSCRSHDLVCQTFHMRQTTNGQIPTIESEVRNYTLPRFEFPPGIEDCDQFYEFLDFAEAVVEKRAKLVIFSGADKRKARSAAIAVYVVLRARIGWDEHKALRAMRASRSQLLKKGIVEPNQDAFSTCAEKVYQEWAAVATITGAQEIFRRPPRQITLI